MAIPAASEWASFDDTVGIPLDISDVLSAILLVDDQLLSKVPSGAAVPDVTHRWVEDQLQANSVTAAEGSEITAGDLTLSVTTGQGARVRIGALLRDKASGKEEILQVTAISTDDLTVTRGYGTTTGETHAATAEFEIVAQPKQEGADTQNSKNSNTKTERNNLAMIFERGIFVTGTYEARKYVVPKDHLKYEINKMLLELRREMSTAVYNSIKSAAGSDSILRTFEGIREALRFTASTNLVTTSESLTPGVLEDLLQQCWDDGGSPNLIATRANLFRRIGEFYSDRIRYAPSDRVRGQFVNKFQSSLGYELDLLANHWVNEGDLVALDMTRVKLQPFRPMKVEAMARTGDAMKWQMLGEYVLEVRNRLESHALHTNLT